MNDSVKKSDGLNDANHESFDGRKGGDGTFNSKMSKKTKKSIGLKGDPTLY